MQRQTVVTTMQRHHREHEKRANEICTAAKFVALQTRFSGSNKRSVTLPRVIQR
jgi:hypothetical protein